MATAWVKSLQCKSTAYDDVYHPKPIKKPLLPPVSCGNSTQALKDVAFLLPSSKNPPKKPKPKPKDPNPKPKPKPKSKSLTDPNPASFPTLTDLPAGHSSRRVVEIIFGSSWSERGASFPGRIEMLFRVHNPHRTVARFEEYRSAVRAARADDLRCSVDGNEMMRFHCAPSLSSCAGGGDGIYDAGVVCCAVSSPGGKGIRTFAGSGGAHESSGGGPGRRAMLVCRVIAGRVRSGSDPESSGDSVTGSGRGELIVFNPRALLPCFLIIYKI